jgi:hypothetical protein
MTSIIALNQTIQDPWRFIFGDCVHFHVTYKLNSKQQPHMMKKIIYKLNWNKNFWKHFSCPMFSPFQIYVQIYDMKCHNS